MVKSRVKVGDYSKIARRKRRLKFTLVLIIILLVISLSLYFLFSSKYQIKNIDVIGSETLNEVEIKNLVFEKLEGRYYLVFPRKNIIIYPHGEVLNSVYSFSEKIKEADVYRSSVNSLKVSIVERMPEYLFCDEMIDKRCFFVDETGLIYTEAPIFSDPVYIEFYDTRRISFVGERVLPRDEFDKVLMLVENLKEAKIIPLTLELVGDTDVYIKVKSGWEIRINYKNDIEEQVRNLAVALLSDALSKERIESRGGIDYIDLRFDKKVYTKFNNE